MSLIKSIYKNDLAAVHLELAEGADPNERDTDGRTPLIHAATENNLKVAELLLSSGAHVNTQDELGNSALHYAAQEYCPEIALLLIRNAADVDLTDIHGNTPLWRAVFNSRGRGELISILLKGGANKNHKNKHGKTPIELAKTIANYDTISFFLRNSEDH